MAEDYFLYVPPNNRPTIKIGDDSKFVLRDFAGVGTALVSPQSQKAPYQIGETFINTDIGPRIVSVSLRIRADNKTDLNNLKNELSASCVIEPLITDIPDLGLLKYFREGLDVFEIEAVPTQSPQFTEIQPTDRTVEAEIEFYCPLAYWRTPTVSEIRIINPESGLFQILEYTENDYDSSGTNENLVVLPNVEGP